MDYNITLIPGDGIGPEIVREARKVMDRVGRYTAIPFNYKEILMGGCSIDAYGVPLTQEAFRDSQGERRRSFGSCRRKCRKFPLV